MNLSTIALCLMVALAIPMASAEGTPLSYSGPNGTFFYTTANTNTYTCSAAIKSGVGRYVTCGIAQYPAGVNEGVTTVLQCPGSYTIECFLFASLGEVGGSCVAGALTELKENPLANSYGHVPNDVGTACLGNNACALTLGVDLSGGATVNGVATGVADMMTAGSKLKLLAVCSGPVGSSAALMSHFNQGFYLMSVVLVVILGLF